MANSDLYACWMLERVGSLVFTIDGVGPVTYASGLYTHVALTLPSPATSPTVLATAMTSSLSGGAHTVAVTWSKANLAYTLTGSGNFAITSLNTLLAAVLGNPTFGGTIGGATTGHSVYTSSTRPYYVVRPYLAGQSNVSPRYQASGRTSGAVSDGGTPYGISKSGVVRQREWTFAHERRAAPAAIATKGTPVDIEDATTLIPWSWEHWRNHVLGHEVSALYNPSGTSAEMFKLRPDSTSHVPVRITQDDDSELSINAAAYIIGTQA